MRYDDPTLRQQLAGAYALGSLRGAARARFERLMTDDAALRRLVVEFQEDLAPLASDAPDVQPPPRVRQRLADAVAPAARQPVLRWWQRVNLWRGLAAANGLFALALVAVVGTGVLQQAAVPPAELVYVGVLADAQDRPGVALLAYNHPFRLEIAAKREMPALPGKELRLWIRDRETGEPEFVSALPPGSKVLPLDDAAWQQLRRAKALIISQQAEGSTAAAPGADILYEGVCVNLKQWSQDAAKP
ncbi:MAG: hypothetical protein KDJ27_13900 [Gammaproteobacteria bacterium]|nr:hypothetical protein [Gammaproteobacteria bacterium]